MKISIKKVISALLAAALSTCVISGCADNSNNPTDTDSNTSVVEEISDVNVSDEEISEQSTVSRVAIPDKYKLKAPVGYTGTTKPEYVAEVQSYICDKYRIYLDDTWTCERAYEDFTGVYGYASSAYNAALLVSIYDGVDKPAVGMTKLEYHKSQISEGLAEYNLREEVETTINGIPTYCYWYEHPVDYTNMMYAFYDTEYYTYCLAGSFTESQSGYYSIQDAISSFEPIDPQPAEDEVVSE